MRKTFFYYLDLILPRRLAIIPYYIAYKYLEKKFSINQNISVWYRNSCYRKNFVLGLSDIDISVMIDTYNERKINLVTDSIKNTRNKFPFLGEVNFYFKDSISNFSPSLNLFEKQRDPFLTSFLIPNSNFDLRVEKIVFLLRMLLSDRGNLLTHPQFRQKKWKIHFKDLGIDYPEFITFDVISNEIIVLLELDRELTTEIKSILEFVFSNEFNESTVFALDLSYYWKFLFPHKYLWFEKSVTEKFDLIKNTILEKICLRQIDWEVWGIMSQLPFIDNSNNGIEHHFNRFLMVVEHLNDHTQMDNRIKQLIELSKKN